MGMARGELRGDRGAHRVRGETVAGLAILAAAAYTRDAAAAEDLLHETSTRSLLCRHHSRLRDSAAA